MHDEGSFLQVVLCSFVYGGSRSKNKAEVSPKGEQNSVILHGERSCTPTNAAFSHNLTPNSSAATWPGSRPDLRNSTDWDRSDAGMIARHVSFVYTCCCK